MTSPPTPVLDVSGYVLRRLDEHLLALSELREQMRFHTKTAPGHRHGLAVTAIVLTEKFAADLHRALQAPGGNRRTAEVSASPAG